MNIQEMIIKTEEILNHLETEIRGVNKVASPEVLESFYGIRIYLRIDNAYFSRSLEAHYVQKMIENDELYWSLAHWIIECKRAVVKGEVK